MTKLNKTKSVSSRMPRWGAVCILRKCGKLYHVSLRRYMYYVQRNETFVVLIKTLKPDIFYDSHFIIYK